MTVNPVINSMKQHLLWIVPAAALLSACGQSEPEDPMRAPPAGGATEENAAQSGMNDNSDTSTYSEDAAMSGSATGDSSEEDLDAAAALNEPVSDGEWVTQPNWTGFGPANSEAVFMVECGEYGMTRLKRIIDVESPQPLRAAIGVGAEEEEGYWKIEDQQENPSAVLEIYSEAPVFDAMKGADKIAVLAEGKPNLVLPGSDALTQQINSCQNQGSGTP